MHFQLLIPCHAVRCGSFDQQDLHHRYHCCWRGLHPVVCHVCYFDDVLQVWLIFFKSSAAGKACFRFSAMRSPVDDALQVWLIFFVLLELERPASGFLPSQDLCSDDAGPAHLLCHHRASIQSCRLVSCIRNSHWRLSRVACRQVHGPRTKAKDSGRDETAHAHRDVPRSRSEQFETLSSGSGDVLALSQQSGFARHACNHEAHEHTCFGQQHVRRLHARTFHASYLQRAAAAMIMHRDYLRRLLRSWEMMELRDLRAVMILGCPFVPCSNFRCCSIKSLRGCMSQTRLALLACVDMQYETQNYSSSSAQREGCRTMNHVCVWQEIEHALQTAH